MRIWVTVFVLAGMAAASTDARAEVVPKATCQPGDKAETALQGQVPWADRLSGRAAEGYNCNLALVSEFRSPAWISLDSYENCAYYSDSDYGTDAGTIVLDVSDPAHPAKTAYLTTPGMQNTHEGMRVNAERGLLVGGHPNRSSLDVYDVKDDCRHPKLLSSIEMDDGSATHEGFFAPDGLTFYASSSGAVTTPVDLADPSHPKPMFQCAASFCQIHGGSTGLDGTRGYFAGLSPDGLEIVDLSTVQHRAKQPDITSISELPFPWNAANQATYPLFYGDKPYLVSFGELSGNPAVGAPLGTPHCPTQVETNFDFPRILDIQDEKNPKIVSKIMLEVMDPLNCPQVIGDNSFDQTTRAGSQALRGLFVYDSHYCFPDRLHDPTILACAQILSGLRVFDIRDPAHVKELAYYNPGTLSPTDPTVNLISMGHPIIRRDLGQIWFTSEDTGFKVLQFESGVWPFPDSAWCPSAYDYVQQQYDMTYDERCLAKAAPPALQRLAPRGLTLKLRRRGRTVRATGALRLPAGRGVEACRGGIVRVGAVRSKLDRRCRYRAKLRVKRGARVRARFLGTAALAPAARNRRAP